MSNATAISAVTGALATLLSRAAGGAISDLVVKTTPPDQMVSGNASNTYLNVFLYQVQADAALRNMNVPRQLPAGSQATPAPSVPPLALSLSYLITAYGAGHDDTLAHLALGTAMGLLADNAILAPQLFQQAQVNSAISTGKPGIDLQLQRERVRVTPMPLSIEDISKLWNTFSCPYRISVMYQVSVVLIDSMQPMREALPVLSPQIVVGAGLVPPYPVLTAATPPSAQPSARLGDTLTVHGYSLGGHGDGMTVNFETPALAAPLTVPVLDANRTATSLTVQIPGSSTATWAAGSYGVSVSRNDPPGPSGQPGASRTSNVVPLAIAPTITTPLVPPTTRSSTSTLTVSCTPAVQPQQSVSLFVADSEVVLPAPTSATSTLAFPIAGLPSGTSYVRLRVGGVESLLVSYQAVPPAFDPSQQVTLP